MTVRFTQVIGNLGAGAPAVRSLVCRHPARERFGDPQGPEGEAAGYRHGDYAIVLGAVAELAVLVAPPAIAGTPRCHRASVVSSGGDGLESQTGAHAVGAGAEQGGAPRRHRGASVGDGYRRIRGAFDSPLHGILFLFVQSLEINPFVDVRRAIGSDAAPAIG